VDARVLFNVLAIFAAPAGWNPSAPALPVGQKTLADYHLAATPQELRRIVSTL